jgi:hypothetical protein
LLAARETLAARRNSIWSSQPERAQLWAVAERCINLLEIAGRVESSWQAEAGTLKAMISAYTHEGGWSELDRAQRLLEQSLAEFTGQDELESVILLCRSCYRRVVDAIQDRFLDRIEAESWPAEGFLRQTQVFDRFITPVLANREKVVLFLADSLRFEMGRDLTQALSDLGQADIQPVCSSVPTITAVGMAALLPGADGTLGLVEEDGDFIPCIGDRLLKDLPARLTFLKEKLGDRMAEVEISKFLSLPSTKKQADAVGKADLLVVRDTRIDNLGETVPLHEARRYMSDMLGDLKAAVNQLVRLGYERFVFATDHGHVLLPEILPGDVVSQAPTGEWGMSKRRVRLGKQVKESAGTRIFTARQLGISGEIGEVILPSGFGVYSDGSGYLHGGLSLQEAVLPVIVLRATARPAEQAVEEISIRYNKTVFTSSAIGVKVWYNSLLSKQIRVRVEAFDGPGAKANKVGEVAECDARDEITHEVTLTAGQEMPVPVLLERDFNGPMVEIRVTSPDAPVVWARLALTNGMMD